MQLLRLHGHRAPLGPSPEAALSPVPALAQLDLPFPADKLWDAAAALSCAASLDAEAAPVSKAVQVNIIPAFLLEQSPHMH